MLEHNMTIDDAELFLLEQDSTFEAREISKFW